MEQPVKNFDSGGVAATATAPHQIAEDGGGLRSRPALSP
jgi:hypothetical protein